MRMVGALLLVPAIAGAQPSPPSSPTAPPQPYVLPFPDEMKVALRAGIASVDHGGNGVYPIQGTGFAFDGEVAYKPLPWFSLSVFVAYAGASDQGGSADLVDAGVRAQFHLAEYAFVGFGLGGERFEEYAAPEDHGMYDLHAGFAIPVSKHFALQAMLVRTAWSPDRDSMTQTTRFVLGFEI